MNNPPYYTIFFFLLLASCKRDVVDPVLKVDFSYAVENNNYTIPVRIDFTNISSNAKYYRWSFEGGNPGSYDQKEPGYIIFNKAGNIKITLFAKNDRDSSTKEITIQLDSVPHANFTATPVINNFGTTEFTISNTSGGGLVQFSWRFEGGNPATSAAAQPGNILFETTGQHRIFLEAINARGRKDTVSKIITVLPPLSSDFDIAPSFDDDDYEAPLKATLLNKTTSATSHKWSASGGVITNTADSIPQVSFEYPGTYKITYESGNGKQSATVTRNITVKQNSKLRVFPNVKLGINTAHETLGAFFSTSLHRVMPKDSITSENSSKVDLSFFGLSAAFNYNVFVSPDSVERWAFGPLPNAGHTKYINKLDDCDCTILFTPVYFDNIFHGNAFNYLTITDTDAGRRSFDNSLLPRVVLFENAAGRKGAVKIRQFVSAGDQSYILCDIKVQKGNE
ncbi:MAG: hypothetical protein QM791_16870 [Ferruginibacter sp.]